jgi:hypothetical protein
MASSAASTWRLKVEDVAPNGHAIERATLRQEKQDGR